MSGTGGGQALEPTQVAVLLCPEKRGDPEQLPFLSLFAHLGSTVLGVGWFACLFLLGLAVVGFRDSECQVSSWYK